jgi:hypothetical protein
MSICRPLDNLAAPRAYDMPTGVDATEWLPVRISVLQTQTASHAMEMTAPMGSLPCSSEPGMCTSRRNVVSRSTKVSRSHAWALALTLSDPGGFIPL